MKKIKVVIVDDSVFIQALLSDILNSDPEILVVGLAENPLIAKQIIKALNPDLLILDVEMPEMDGLTFLEKLMRLHPMPVIMCSAFSGCREVTVEALKLGVIDFISKPILRQHHAEIISKVKNAVKAKLTRLELHPEAVISVPYHPKQNALSKSVLAMGASTGGTEALKYIFEALPVNMPPIVVTLHIPEVFTNLFVERINKISKLKASEAKEGELLKPGHIYIAPGGKHLELRTNQKGFYFKFSKRDHESGHKPSIDVMMESVAQEFGKHSIGILLSGMGADGAKGMLALKNAGGITIAQDEETAVVWGMPKVAIELNAINYVLPLQQIPEKMLQCINEVAS